MLRVALIVGCLAVLPGGVLRAEEQPTSVEDVEALVRRIRQQLEAMDAATRARDQNLEFLKKQVDQATGRLEGTDATNEALRAKVGELDSTVTDLTTQRQELDRSLAATTQAKETTEQQLARKIAELEQVLATERDLGRQAQAAAGERERATGNQLAAATAQVADLTAQLDAERGRTTELQAASAAQLASGQAELSASKAEVERLNGQLAQARTALNAVQIALGQTESRVGEQQATIADLGKRLDEALAKKVEELSRYRSEFFGTLRDALGDRPDIRVVGDRFVLQSELVFDSGSDRISAEGQAELAKVAATLKQIAGTIPASVPWVLRVDGHTDRQPLRSDSRFASNWELSTARAVAVVQYLISQGLPPERLAAAGFGEYKPLDPRDDEIAYRRNRRIEFKLTES